MGIQGLIPFLDKVSSRINLAEFKGCCVAVDAYCWLHRGAYTCAEKLVKGEKCDAYVYYCMKYVNMLLSHNIKPILVFDGRHLPAKAGTEKKRRESRAMNRKTAAELMNAGRVDEARNFLRRCVDVTHSMALALIKECRKINVDCIVAPYEADAQLAYLNLQNIAQVVITEDSDLILFGCSKIIFKLDLQGYGLLVERDRLHLSMGVRAENFNFDSFRYMCILSGCDYLPSLPGIGLNKALKFINKTKDPDIHRALRRMPSYLNMTQLKVSEEYRDSFVSADATFRYQPVFDPRSRTLVPLTNPPEGEEPPAIVNEKLLPNIAFQLALGNLDPFTLERVDNFNPDCPQQGVLSLQRRCWNSSAASTHPSIWLPDFPGFQPLPEKTQFPAMLNCSAVLDVTPLHKPKASFPNASETEENSLPSPAELQSMYGSNKTSLHPSKRLCSDPRDNVLSPSVSHSPQDNVVPKSDNTLQQPTSPVLNPRRTRNPFAKPKQNLSAGLGPPGAMGLPNFFSALRKFDGIYPMDVDTNVVIVSRYFRSCEVTDKQPFNPEKHSEVILKDMSNTSSRESTNNILEEDKILAGYSCEKENSCDLNSHQNESVLDTIEAAQNKLISPSQSKQSTNMSNEGKDERVDTSTLEIMEVDSEEDISVLRQTAESGIFPRSPSFNWNQFTSKRSLLSSKLACSQAVSQTFKNPFRKKSVTKCVGLSQQISEEISHVEGTDSAFSPSNQETNPEVYLETQEISKLSKTSSQATNFSGKDMFNCSQDESPENKLLKDTSDSSTPTTERHSSEGARVLENKMELLEDFAGREEQVMSKAEEETMEDNLWSCGSSDSGYQGSQEAPKSVSHGTEKKKNLFSTPSAGYGRNTPSRRRLGLGLTQAPKQNLLAQYGFSKKRKLSH